MVPRLFMVPEILNSADQTIWFRLNRLLDRPDNSTHPLLEVRTLINNGFKQFCSLGFEYYGVKVYPFENFNGRNLKKSICF